jgi:broad specificity phosphatase PhoE
MIIRHGEKPSNSGRSPGIDPDGHSDDHSLTARGWTRARALVQLFAPAAGAIRPGLSRPTAIYASGGTSGQGRRTRQTIAPLAARLGVAVNTEFAKGDESALARQVAGRPGSTLICWQHGELPDIVRALVTGAPHPPTSWPDDRFDLIWTLAPANGGWSFHQIPELLLDGDSNRSIA